MEQKTPHNFIINQTLRKQHLEEIQEKQKYPIIIITGASWAWKSSVTRLLFEKLKHHFSQCQMTPLHTNRIKKERDLENDFLYHSKESLQSLFSKNQIIYAFESWRSTDDYTFCLTKDQLLQTQNWPIIVVIGKSALSSFKQVHEELDVISVNIYRTNEEISSQLSLRNKEEADYVENIRNIQKNLTEFLGKSGNISLNMHNKNIELCAEKIVDYIRFKGQEKNKHFIEWIRIAITENILQTWFFEFYDFLRGHLLNKDWTLDTDKLHELFLYINYVIKHDSFKKQLSSLAYLVASQSKLDLTNENPPRVKKFTLDKKWEHAVELHLRYFYTKLANFLLQEGYKDEAVQIALQAWVELHSDIKLNLTIEKKYHHNFLRKVNELEGKDFQPEDIFFMLERYFSWHLERDYLTEKKEKWDTRIYKKRFTNGREVREFASRMYGLLDSSQGVTITSSTHYSGKFACEFEQPVHWYKKLEVHIAKYTP